MRRGGACRSVFDTDSIDLGPERRQYLDHQLSRLWEVNSQGSIPYVPLLRAPYYCWIGHVPQLATVLSENKVCNVAASFPLLALEFVTALAAPSPRPPPPSLGGQGALPQRVKLRPLHRSCF